MAVNIDWDDENVDRETVNEMAAQGQIEILVNEDGSISTIDGNFTDDKVVDISDAVDVLNTVSSLFGNFSVSVTDITEQSVNDGAEVETFYRYNPTVAGIPVYGSQIILSSDDEGNVSGLFSSYDNTIFDVDTVATLSDTDAENIAFSNLLNESNIDDCLSSMVSDEISRPTIDSMFKDSLQIDSGLVVYAVGEQAELAVAVADIDDAFCCGEHA